MDSRGVWKVRVRFNGERFHVGYFAELADAREAFARVIVTGELPARQVRALAVAPKVAAACACGCGELASPGRTWLRGHQWRNGLVE